MRPLLVVVLSPRLDDDFGFGPASKPFQAQALVSELAVEALIQAVLPGFARVNQGGGNAVREQPA